MAKRFKSTKKFKSSSFHFRSTAIIIVGAQYGRQAMSQDLKLMNLKLIFFSSLLFFSRSIPTSNHDTIPSNVQEEKKKRL